MQLEVDAHCFTHVSCVTCRTTQAGLTNVLGALYATTLFFSIINATVIQPVIAAERAVSYRERAAGMYSVFPFTLALVSYSSLMQLAPDLTSSRSWLYPQSVSLSLVLHAVPHAHGS